MWVNKKRKLLMLKTTSTMMMMMLTRLPVLNEKLWHFKHDKVCGRCSFNSFYVPQIFFIIVHGCELFCNLEESFVVLMEWWWFNNSFLGRKDGGIKLKIGEFKRLTWRGMVVNRWTFLYSFELLKLGLVWN